MNILLSVSCHCLHPKVVYNFKLLARKKEKYLSFQFATIGLINFSFVFSGPLKPANAKTRGRVVYKVKSKKKVDKEETAELIEVKLPAKKTKKELIKPQNEPQEESEVELNQVEQIGIELPVKKMKKEPVKTSGKKKLKEEPVEPKAQNKLRERRRKSEEDFVKVESKKMKIKIEDNVEIPKSVSKSAKNRSTKLSNLKKDSNLSLGASLDKKRSTKSLNVEKDFPMSNGVTKLDKTCLNVENDLPRRKSLRTKK